MKTPTFGKKIQKENYPNSPGQYLIFIIIQTTSRSLFPAWQGASVNERQLMLASTVFFEEHQGKIVLWFLKSSGYKRDDWK